METDAYSKNAPPPYSTAAPGPSRPANGIPGQIPVKVTPAPATMILGGPVVPVFTTNNMGPNPTTFTCPSCNYQITTRTKKASSTRTHVFAILLCFVGCCCIPYFMNSCKNTEHYCPDCNAYLGSYVT